MLLAPLDFVERRQYLQARGTLLRLLELGVVPVVNENDAIADDEIRFGDNDRIAALVAHLIDADLLVLLTDTPGLLTADPRLDPSASLIEEIVEIDHEPRGRRRRRRHRPGQRRDGLEAGRRQDRRLVGRAHRHRRRRAARRARRRRRRHPGRRHGRAAPRPRPARPASSGSPSPSAPRARWWSTPGPERALERGGVSLLPAGVERVEGDFDADDAVEISDTDGVVFAKGLVRVSSAVAADMAGRRSTDLADGVPRYLVHADDLVILP